MASYSYTLDAADRLTQETRTWDDGSSSDTTDYTYTDNNQLTGVDAQQLVVRQRDRSATTPTAKKPHHDGVFHRPRATS